MHPVRKKQSEFASNGPDPARNHRGRNMASSAIFHDLFKNSYRLSWFMNYRYYHVFGTCIGCGGSVALTAACAVWAATEAAVFSESFPDR